MWIRKLIPGLILTVFAWLAVGCGSFPDPVSSGVLAFDQDTVKFDSIFTTLQAPTRRLIVYNNAGEALNIDSVWLVAGTQSEYKLIVDGIQGNSVRDLILDGNDSLHVFITLKSQLKDNFSEEFIAFRVGEEVQQVLIRGFVLDAYFLQARLLQPDVNSLAVQGFFFDQDTTLTPEKPIIVDGPILILPGVTVTILPGTQLFFTPYKFGIKDSNNQPIFVFFSTLIVYGTLNAEGTALAPILLTGSRLDSNYRDNPAQWRGVRFGAESKDNVLRHVQIKNGLVGLQIDSLSVNSNPKVLAQYCEIRNMGSYGIWGLGFDLSGTTALRPPSLLMENSIVSTCKERTFFAYGGGKYDFYNCTFANFNLAKPRFSRRSPQVLINNYYVDATNTATVYPCLPSFTNCILWGSEDDEFVLDTFPGVAASDIRLRNCIVKTTSDYLPFVSPHYRDCQVNTNPLFNNYVTWDYRPQESSPVINAGIDFPVGSTGYQDDFRGKSDSLRYDGFDIGALEYYLIPQ